MNVQVGVLENSLQGQVVVHLSTNPSTTTGNFITSVAV